MTEYFRSYGRSFLGHEDGVLFMGEYVVMDVGEHKAYE